MIEIWAARSPDKSRIRLQDEPFDTTLWRHWAIRSGLVDEELWFSLPFLDDDVAVERFHQEIWIQLAPG